MSAAANVLAIDSPDAVWQRKGEPLKWQRKVTRDKELLANSARMAWTLFLHCLSTPRWQMTVEELGEEIGLKRAGAYKCYAQLCERKYVRPPTNGYLEIIPCAISQSTFVDSPSPQIWTEPRPHLNSLKRHNLQETEEEESVAAAVVTPAKNLSNEAAAELPRSPAAKRHAPEKEQSKADPEIVRELEQYGIEPATARMLAAKYPLDQIRNAVECFQQRGGTINPAGWLRRAIENGYRCYYSTSCSEVPEDGPPFELWELRAYLQRNASTLRRPGYMHIAEALTTVAAGAEEHYANLERLEQYLVALESDMAEIAYAHHDVEAIRRDLQATLKPYRSKMTAEQLAMLERQYIDHGLLEAANLPRLSLFYLTKGDFAKTPN